MDSKNTARTFLTKHNFTLDIADKLHQRIIADMEKGLSTGGSDQAMIKAGYAAAVTIQEGQSAIVIDAGGTNFRSCLVTKKKGCNGIEISDFKKTSMPAIDRELSKNEFFTAIADNISRLKDRSDRISFCFSYAMAITEDGDGKIIRFSKEIKAKEAVGSYIGKELLAVLKKQGWTRVNKINLLNDTTALLLSSYLADCQEWGGRMAFILGTGMNSAYVKKGRIIVTECGMFSQLAQSDFDLTVCSRTNQPKQSLLEKMTSGAYMGEISFEMIKTACREKLFSEAFISEIEKLSFISTADFDEVLIDRKQSTEKTGTMPSHLMAAIEKGNDEDLQLLKELLTAIISRSANLTAETICAAALSSDKEKEGAPLCISCNGSTFWKTPMLKEMAEKRLKSLLSADFEIIQIEDDITKGSFAAAFISK